MMKAAIMGYGTIGSGVAEILEKNRDVIAQKAGQEIALKYVLDLREFPESPVADKIIHDFKVIEADREVGIVVETMGGLNPAYPFVKACLEAGKHVATSNKALVAAHGTELLRIAREKNVNFFFEASVGGGIPIVRSLYRSLAGERIEEIAGILNGTTNYILTKMEKEGETFGEALREAQDLGYAERNPEADVEGWDTCRKIAILTAMATGKEINFEDIYTEGITQITDTDFKYAQVMGTSIKLFGASRMEGDRTSAFVAPVMIGKDHPLYSVRDVYNGILVKGNMLGTKARIGGAIIWGQQLLTLYVSALPFCSNRGNPVRGGLQRLSHHQGAIGLTVFIDTNRRNLGCRGTGYIGIIGSGSLVICIASISAPDIDRSFRIHVPWCRVSIACGCDMERGCSCQSGQVTLFNQSRAVI